MARREADLSITYDDIIALIEDHLRDEVELQPEEFFPEKIWPR